VAYGPSTQQTLDVYQPPNRTSQTPKPAIVFIHGGGWTGGDKDDFKDLAVYFSQQGFVTFSVNYRLVWTPELRHPVPYDDVQTAMRFLRSRATLYGIDPGRMGAMGGSAGGHLVGLLGTTETRDNSNQALAAYSSRATCVVDLFGPMDLMMPLPTTPDDIDWLVFNLIGDTRENAPQAYRDASPIEHIDATTVPFLIFQGGADPIVPAAQSQAFHEALLAAELESELVVFPAEGHGFAAPESNAVFIQKSLDFFRTHLN